MNAVLKPPPAIRIFRVGFDPVVCPAADLACATAAPMPAVEVLRNSRLRMRGMLTQTMDKYREDATFYRTALLLGLVRGDAVIQWSDAVLACDADAPSAFVEIASTPHDDLSAMRHALYPLCDDRESPPVVARILAVVSRDLESGRRSFEDTTRILSQVRRFLKLEPAMDEALKALLVEVWQARNNLGGEPATAETRARGWLRRYE